MSTNPPTDSLVELAARKRLPRHQYTDHTTVEWIKANRPDHLPDVPPPRLRPAPQRLLTRTAIPGAWLAEPRLLNSLHGVRHAMRTAALAALLAEITGLDEDDTATLILAASVHDCRRLHDKDDPGHGPRAATWLVENAEAVWDHFHLCTTPQAVERAAIAVRLHERPYVAFTTDDRTDHARAEHVSDLLKAADALDRYRLPKLSWWPDAAHIRVPAAFDALRATAFDLVVHSEAAHLTGAGSADAVLEALEAHGVVR
ncbi:HD domain-containing protein [Streptomyces barkulensis]|uniref:HD domain-containing protein n=1 Tax=Streptomyces barkulensis TaxID=1257026 RepID=UPI000C6E54A1|nr:HD domain-containing protein [Streptomyces barkulensis]